MVPNPGKHGKVTVYFGEDMKTGRVNRQPRGTVRYQKTEVALNGREAVLAEPPADRRNSAHAKAVRTPNEWGVVLPFRWAEIEGWKGPFSAENIIRQSAFSATWDDEAAEFKSSNELLNQIWALCKYSIKATTFAGVYIDGDRDGYVFTERNTVVNAFHLRALELMAEIAEALGKADDANHYTALYETGYKAMRPST